MGTALLDRRGTPVIEGLDFDDPTPVLAWMPAGDDSAAHEGQADAIRFLDPMPVAPDVGSVKSEHIDEVVCAISRHYGHDPNQIQKVLFILRRNIDGRRQRSTFRVTVERDRQSRRFTAWSNVLMALGHGETVGEAFSSCLDEAFDRADFLALHQDELAPGLQDEADRFHRWAGTFA